jgi:beta-glucosidase
MDKDGNGYSGFTHAISRLDFPSITNMDGPHGFRSHIPGLTTEFPSEMAMASTWDPDMVYKWGAAMG